MELISEKNLYRLSVNSESRGELISMDYANYNNVPFEPRRMFVVKNVPEGMNRGGHAHYSGRQLLVCLKGKIKVYLNDGVSDTDEVHLLSENDTLYIPNLIWDRYIFKTKETVLMVLSSTEYDRSDYIDDFGKFQEIKAKRV